MKRITIWLTAILLLTGSTLRADEGMWLLPLIEKLNMKDMKSKGLKLTAKDIYSINNSSLKDAIVIFGGGCTGELISDKGLLLTNHHCGYGAIQQHSSVEHDYLRDGFWAMSMSEEIPSPGLAVTFLNSIEDVTAKILPELEKITDEVARGRKEGELMREIVKGVEVKQFSRATVVPMYAGNAYYLFVYTTFTDVRMVGAPPSSIGKFGADTDNWVWPRHTGDFSLFRIYANKDNEPAAYSPDNVPYKPAKSLKISLKGFSENDYAMVMGYPGSTSRFMTSYEINERADNSNANRILIRGIRQEIWMADMQADQKTRIQYSSKYSGSSNYWKNSMGMNEALAKLNVANERATVEQNFAEWVSSSSDRKAKYGNAVDLIKQSVENSSPINYELQYLSECLLSTEIVSIAGRFAPVLTAMRSKLGNKDSLLNVVKQQLTRTTSSFYKDYSVSTDRKTAKAMFKLYAEKVKTENQPEVFQEVAGKYRGDYDGFVDQIFDTSIFTDSTKVLAFLANPDTAKLKADMAFSTATSVRDKYMEQARKLTPYNMQYRQGHREYIAGTLDMNKGKAIYPDANFTMRLTYGNIKGYTPRDGVRYTYYTTLKGVMEKEDPNNWEFVVPQKLKDLYNTKDFGPYALSNGEMPVCFIFNGDITGGNSGSPVLNGKGELIGCAFDGNWEALSGDIVFEPELQRCINVDIRYVLFIIDKFAGAQNLINEMNIVK